MNKQILPAYPLLLIDPLFSIWSGTDELNDSQTMFWTSKERKSYGLVRYSGKSYYFLGIVEGAIKLQQTDVSITAYTTDYTFSCQDFDLKVSFISPLMPEDVNMLSCPTCYISYNFIPKVKSDDFSIVIAFDEEHCYNEQMPLRGGVFNQGSYEAAWFGLRRQMPLSLTQDLVGADWGYTYLCAQSSYYLSFDALQNYIATGKIKFVLTETERKLIVGMQTDKQGFFTVGFDDTCSIMYFGDFIKGYYFKDNKTIFDALNDSIVNYNQTITRLNDADKKLVSQASKYGSEYTHILRAALRQSIAAHKLIADKDNNLIFLSKECDSNGCIGTVDVSYPSMPLFLLYNPELVNAMIRPVFKFARTDVWQYDFAPHDVGQYPYVCGQVYGIKNNDDKYHAGQVGRFRNQNYTHSMYYQWHKNSDIYDINSQMPVEECSNMLILTAAAMIATNNSTLAAENFDLLTNWKDYLVENGLMPSNQLSTDDFAGHSQNNINLSAKAIVGIEAYSVIAKFIGEFNLSKQALKTAEQFVEKWKIKVGENVSQLSFGDIDTYSLKYNILFDKLFGFNFFGEQINQREIEYYIKNSNEFGIPLDSRATYTKSDWILWCAALTDDIQKSKAVFMPVYKFLINSKSRVPFSDWYDTVTGKYCRFQNRTVQGGLFSLLLKDNQILNQK